MFKREKPDDNGGQIEEQFPAKSASLFRSPSPVREEEDSTKSSLPLLLLTLPALLSISVARVRRALRDPRFCSSLAWAAGASLSDHGASRTDPSLPRCPGCSSWWAGLSSPLARLQADVRHQSRLKLKSWSSNSVKWLFASKNTLFKCTKKPLYVVSSLF